MSRKRTNKQHLEYIFVPSGNQAMPVTGNLSSTTNNVNVADGQLGAIVATHDANVPGLSWGDFLPASTSAQDIDAIKLVMGTPNSANTVNVTGWEDGHKGFLQSPIIHRDKVRAFSARVAQGETYNATSFSGFNTPTDETLYKLWVELRSVRNDRDFGKNVETLPISYTTPDYSSLPTITQPLAHLIQNVCHKINLQSQAISTAPSFRSKGKKPVIAFAIDVSGGSGKTLGSITCGDVITVMTSGSTTSSFVADQTFVDTVDEWLNATGTPFTVASTIENINIATAGTAGTPAIDSFVIMGLDQTTGVSYDDIYSVKVRADVELAGGFRVLPLFTEVKLSHAFDGLGNGRTWRIRFDSRAFGNQHNLQLTGYQDNVIAIPNYLDEAKSYSAFVLDLYDESETLTSVPQTQKRVVILMECTESCVLPGVAGTYTASAVDGDTIEIGSETFESDSSSDGVGAGNVAYDGTAGDLKTQIDATFTGVTSTVVGSTVVVTNKVNAQATTVASLNNVLGYWLDTARVHGNAFNINLDSEILAGVAPDGSGNPTGTVPGSGVYFG